MSKVIDFLFSPYGQGFCHGFLIYEILIRLLCFLKKDKDS